MKASFEHTDVAPYLSNIYSCAHLLNIVNQLERGDELYVGGCSVNASQIDLLEVLN